MIKTSFNNPFLVLVFAIAVIAGWLIYSDLLLTFTVLLIGLVIYFKTGVQYGDWFLGIDDTNLQENE